MEASVGIYIPNIDAEQFNRLCKEHGLEIIAVPVPPHGRLGDLDKLADNMRSATAGMEHRAIIMHEIRRAPTIIPADQAEEGE